MLGPGETLSEEVVVVAPADELRVVSRAPYGRPIPQLSLVSPRGIAHESDDGSLTVAEPDPGPWTVSLTGAPETPERGIRLRLQVSTLGDARAEAIEDFGVQVLTTVVVDEPEALSPGGPAPPR